MKIFKTLMVGVLVGASTFAINAQSLSDILGGLGGKSNTGNVLGSVIEGVFSKSNLTVADLVGEYRSEGPAVTFKSENFLQKAGGIAGAAAIESKLNPYYEKYGLNNMTLSVDTASNFVMKVKSLNLKGFITQNESEGTFDFNFNVAGIKLGKFTAYIEKSGSNLKLMFDASKLKDIVSAIAKFTGNNMASALGSILDSYDGACIGFKLVSTSQNNSSGSAISNGIGTLKDILKGGGK